VIQPMIPLHECATEPLQDVVKSIADPATDESVAEPLLIVANLTAAGATPTETSCLCVRV
jgi:hypothetical protein